MTKLFCSFFTLTIIIMAVFLNLSGPTMGRQVYETNAGGCKRRGEFCGGFAGFACCKGLRCLLKGDYADAGGVCKPLY
ncbi:hypothetical protein RND81_12G226900 [Saponaria officinalis]|uniref:Uncharacterized protein n=1 Tax=Saponaria officinalis TaxID=3572 RepID=A0AAW1HE38_SAPOF